MRTSFGPTNHIEVLLGHFDGMDHVTVLGRGPSALEIRTEGDGAAVLVTDPTYALQDVFAGNPRAVMIGDASQVLPKVAQRYHATSPDTRPLLMHPCLPEPGCVQAADFKRHGLPPPLPVASLLNRHGLYTYHPGQPYPTSGVFLALTAALLDRPIVVAGIDLYRHPTGRMYVDSTREIHPTIWPAKHAESVDTEHLRRIAQRLGPMARAVGTAAEILAPL